MRGKREKQQQPQGTPGPSLARPAGLPERHFRPACAAVGAGELGNRRPDLPAAVNLPAGARSRPCVLRFPGCVADASWTLGNWRERQQKRDEQRRRLRFGLRLRPHPYCGDSGDEPVVGGDQRADADAFFLPRRNRGAAALPPGVSARASWGRGTGAVETWGPRRAGKSAERGRAVRSRDRPVFPRCPRLIRAQGPGAPQSYPSC